MYQEAVRACKAKNYQKAIKLFRRVIEFYPYGPYAEPSRQALSEIETLATQMLSPVEVLVLEEQFSEAIALLRTVRRQFPGSKAAATAEARFRELERSPALAEAVKRAEAQDLLAEGWLLIEKGELLRGVEVYTRLAERYPDTPQGKEARQRLGRFAADEECQRQLRHFKAQAKCRSLLSLARNYRSNKAYGAAKECYQKLIEQFPDTEFAIVAAEELKEMEQEMREGAEAEPPERPR